MKENKRFFEENPIVPNSNRRMFWTSLNGSVILLDRNSKFQAALEMQLTLEFGNEGFISMNYRHCASFNAFQISVSA